MIGPFRAFLSISSEVPVSAQSSRDNDMGDKTFTNNLISAEKTHYIHTIYIQMQMSSIGEIVFLGVGCHFGYNHLNLIT